jgi:hypothetical protein
MLGNQKAGYLTKFGGHFSFMTVHTAGHEAPAYQPARSLALLQLFLQGSVFSGVYDNGEEKAEGGWTPVLTALAIIICITGAGIGIMLLFFPRKDNNYSSVPLEGDADHSSRSRRPSAAHLTTNDDDDVNGPPASLNIQRESTVSNPMRS